MSNPNRPKSLAPNNLPDSPRSEFVTSNRSFIYAAMAATALSGVACGDDPDPPTRSMICMTALDQEDQPMEKCDFAYRVNQGLLDEDEAYAEEEYDPPGDPVQYRYNPNACGKGQLNVYSTPGLHRIYAECGKLAGRLEVDLAKGQNDPYKSRLIGSFCTDDFSHVADPKHTEIMLNDHLGFSNDTWCDNKLSKPELVRTEVVDLVRQCEEGEADCDPKDGRDLLKANGTPGQYTDGQPKHLTFTARTDLLADSEEVKLLLTLKQKDSPIQQLDMPVTLYGPVCGNGIIESREECEVDNVKGLTCEGYDFTGGELECVDCKISLEKCTND